jgi:hypothetical protein
VLFQYAHEQNRVDELVGVGCCNDNDGLSLGDSPCASRVDVSKEYVEAGGEHVEQDVVDPRHQQWTNGRLFLHGVFLFMG